MKELYTPDWLQEILDHGFVPDTIHDDFKGSFFGHIEANSAVITKVPKVKLYALEGIPGVGKTTLLQKFAKEKNVKTIPQILPFEPEEGSAVDHDFYRRSDILKTERWRASKSPGCLLDRYYVSTLAFTWSYDKLYGTKAYPSLFAWYKRSLESYALVRPYKVFYIEVSIGLSFQRKGRKPSTSSADPWLNPAFLEAFNSYYHHFYSEIEPGTKVVTLSADQPLDTLYETIKREMDDGK